MEQKQFFDIIFYLATPAFIIGAVYILLKKFFDREYNLKLLELKKQMQRDTVPMRLQAYERLVLFLERISPNNLLQRIMVQEITAREFQMDLISTIRSEFEHNLTQQVYISAQAWLMVRNAKEEMIRIINISSDSMNPMAPAMDLSKAIFETMLRNEDFPTQKAIDTLKLEAANLF